MSLTWLTHKTDENQNVRNYEQMEHHKSWVYQMYGVRPQKITFLWKKIGSWDISIIQTSLSVLPMEHILNNFLTFVHIVTWLDTAMRGYRCLSLFVKYYHVTATKLNFQTVLFRYLNFRVKNFNNYLYNRWKWVCFIL